jgi:hypothetical protein
LGLSAGQRLGPYEIVAPHQGHAKLDLSSPLL